MLLLLLFPLVLAAAPFGDRIKGARQQYLKQGTPFNASEAIMEMEEYVINLAEQGICEICLICSDSVLPFKFMMDFQAWLNKHPGSEKVGGIAIEQLVIRWNNQHPSQQLNCTSPGKCWLKGWCE